MIKKEQNENSKGSFTCTEHITMHVSAHIELS